MSSKVAIDPKKFKGDLNERLARMKKNPNVSQAKIGVNVKLIKDYLKEVNSRGFSFYCDEPSHYGDIRMGGTDKGPPPLTYFLGGIGCCELSFYTVCATMLGVSIDSMELDIVGELDWNGPYGLNKNSSFKGFTTTVKIKSKENKKKIRDLVKLVHRSCPAYNTIVNPVPIRNVLYLNGSKLS
ncbi:MAG: OsmC-related (seleno)protein [Nitrososphaerales archaeon]